MALLPANPVAGPNILQVHMCLQPSSVIFEFGPSFYYVNRVFDTSPFAAMLTREEGGRGGGGKGGGVLAGCLILVRN